MIFTGKNNKKKIPENLPFTDRQFLMIVAPLFVERLLQMVVGLTDTFVISYTGEASVSGVSLVNQFNNVLIYLSTALAAGGAVITSQYIGSRDREKAGEASSQLLSASTLLLMLLALISLAWKGPILRFLFGKVDADVMDAALIYLRISAYSFPAIAIYDSGAALFRSLGKTKTTMYVSMISNVINVIGNCIGVFVLKAGVAGVAWPSLIARYFSAVVITLLCFRRSMEVHYTGKYVFRFNIPLLKKMLGIALPNGVESGVFQLVKVAMSSIVALFGTSQIAANGVSQTFMSLSNAFGNAGGPAFTTVIGQCMGDNNTEAAEYYFHRFDKILVVFGGLWNALIVILLPGILHFYALEPQTKQLILLVMVVHNLFCFWLFPYWGAAPCGLRAAGDVRYTMTVSVVTTVAVRLVLSYVFGVTFGMGYFGVVIAMIVDWIVKSVCMVARVNSGKWKRFKLI